jgi:3-methyladenine DNA glycosylase AlkD
MTTSYRQIISRLEALSDPASLAGMARFGIVCDRAYGVRIPELRRIAKEAGRNHPLALRLWREECRETRILAGMLAEPAKVTEGLMEEWVAGFDNWETCDQVCMNLFEKTPFAWGKALAWPGRQEELVKRAGFVLMARLAVSDKQAPDGHFEAFFPLICREAGDGRNYVKKGVNWALRQIGKRNRNLHRRAVAIAEEIAAMESRSARWIAADALRELTDQAVLGRIR